MRESTDDRPGTNSDRRFLLALALLGGSYLLFIVLLLVADFAYLDASALGRVLRTPQIRYAIGLSLVSSTIAAILSVWVAVPIAYLCSRFEFRGKSIVDTIIDVPVVLPPLVVGVSLLVLFNFPPFALLSDFVVFEIPAVILAQFTVACAFTVRTLRVCFDEIPVRYERVAMTLGCNRSQAFWRITMPQARSGIIAAATLAWARAFGEFGPVLVFAGASRMHTEVLPTSVYFEMQTGNLQGMLAVSFLMILAAGVVLLAARILGVPGGRP